MTDLDQSPAESYSYTAEGPTFGWVRDYGGGGGGGGGGNLASDILDLPILDPINGSEYVPLATSGPSGWKQTLTEIFNQMGPMSTSFTRGVSIVSVSPHYTGSDTNRMLLELDARIYTNELVLPQFSNAVGISVNFVSRNADASYSVGSIPGSAGTDAKTTLSPSIMSHTANAGGQRFIRIEQMHGYGMGDCFFQSQIGDFANGPLPGDEGIGWSSTSRFFQQDTPTTANLTSVFRASGNTTTTEQITADLPEQEISVASAANINVGEWYVIERRVPKGYYNTEAVKIIAVNHSTQTITAKFRNNHFVGVTVTPALVLSDPFPGNTGQLRVVVNRSAPGYSVGNVTGTFGGGALTGGGGTNWTTNMVGGDAINIGAISMVNDDYTSTSLRSWYEINGVASTTQINICRFSVAGDESYQSSRNTFPSTYRIQPAVRVLYIAIAEGAMICETTSTPWVVGNQVELAVCPYPDITGLPRQMACYTPGATFRSLMGISNAGPVPCDRGLGIFGLEGAATDKGYGLGTGLGITGSAVGISIVMPALAITNVTPAAIELSGNIANTNIAWADNGATINRNAFGGLQLLYGGSSTGLQMSNVGTAINADANLRMFKIEDGWLNIDGIPGTQRAYIMLDTLKIWGGESSGAGQSAVEHINGYSVINLSGPAAAPYTRFSTAHAFGLGTNGVLQTARLDLTGATALVNGANGTVTLATPASFVRITGPTGAFSIAGIIQADTTWSDSGSRAAGDGTELQIYNSTAFAMTIVNNSGTPAGAGFSTLTGADIVLPARTSSASFKYSSSEFRWIMLGQS